MSTKVESYCVNCADKREMKDVIEVEMQNKQKAKKGKCVVCGTKMYKIV